MKAYFTNREPEQWKRSEFACCSSEPFRGFFAEF